MWSPRGIFAAPAVYLIVVSAAFGAPTVQTLNPVAGSTVASLTSISVTFSESVTAVDADDLLINNEAASLISGSGAGPYVFTFTQPPPGIVSVSWDFDHGIAGLGTGAFVPVAGWNYTLTDTLAPTVGKITTSQTTDGTLDAIVPLPTSTVGALTQTEVTFSEIVTGVDAADLRVNGIAATNVSGSGAGPYLFSFAQPAAGTVTFSWAAAHGIVDTAANAFAGGSWTVTLSATGPGVIVINEFLAANATGIRDENLDYSDWIELYNSGTGSVNLAGWSLSNDADTPGMWIFPSRTLAAGAYLVVFASGKDRKPAAGNLHTNFTLGADSGYLALYPPDSPRVATSRFPPNYNPLAVPPVTDYPPQRYNYSYGPQTGGALRYFAVPTVTQGTPPVGVANGTSSLTGITPRPNTSVSRGFFKDPVQVLLSCADATATIRYTLDGSVPIVTSATYSQPLVFSTTTVLRVVAFGATTIPSDTVTHSYIYLDAALNQASPPYDNPARADDNGNPALPTVSSVPLASGGVQFPVAWGTNGGFAPPAVQLPNLTSGQIPADYGMDPEVLNDPNKYDDTGAINNATGKLNIDRIKQGLRDLPMLSVVMKNDDMFGASGLYPNSLQKGVTYEKACSVELLLPDGTTGFSTTCGIRIHGNASRDPLKNPKHGFKLNFKGSFGASSLGYALFPDSPVKEFDDLILRGDFNSSWTHWDGSGTGVAGGQRARGTRLRDAFCKDTFRAMGRVAGHHRYVNLFINGVYWGTYDPTEQENNGFAAAYFGGNKDDYAVYEQSPTIKSGVDTKLPGDAQTPYVMLSTTLTNATTPGIYTQYKRYLDVPEFIDYMLLHFYLGHEDWGDDVNKNWYAFRNSKTGGTFKYIPWDMENLMWSETVDRTGVPAPPTGIHPKLKVNTEYRLEFADRVNKHMVMPGGALLPAANIARWNKWQAIITNAIACESARWGDYRRDVHQYQGGPYPLYTWNGSFIAEVNRLKNTYFPVRTTNVLTQFRTAGLYPTLNAPEFHNESDNALVGSQPVTAGYRFKLLPPAAPPAGTTNSSTIYYTLDGADPRVAFDTTGARTPTAVLYSPPYVEIPSTKTVKARALNGTVWSALAEATFTTGAPQPAIQITEINYNPKADQGGNSAEFIEIQNTGTKAVDLSGWSFDGVDFVLPAGLLIGPNAQLVFASNNAPATFASQYPTVSVAGYFGGSLDNGGERLSLLDAVGRIVVSVDYDDAPPWATGADGGGSSLEIIDVNGDPDDPLNWKASSVPLGSPGAANPAPPVQSIELSEVRTGATGGFIELRNKSAGIVDISGWQLRGFLSGAIPTSPSLNPGDFYVLNLTNIPTDAGTLAVYTDATLTTRVDGVSWGNQIAGYSIGRVAGVWTLCTPTSGAANSAAPTTAPTNLALNEWLANTGPGETDWVELFNKHATLPVALDGVFVQTSTQLYQISSLAFIAPQGWLQMPADESPGGNHLDLKLDAAGTTLKLLDSAGASLDTVTFGAQAQSVTAGRLPDGTGAIVAFPGSASPGAANYLASAYTGPVLNEVLARNVNGDQAPWGTRADWVELENPGGSSFAVGGMKLGRTNNFAAAWAIPAGTSIVGGGRLAIWCDSTQPASTVADANLNTGFSLNGQNDGLYLFNAAGQLVSSIAWGPQIVDRSIGRDGGTWNLLATVTRGLPNAAAAALGVATNLRINEWAAGMPTGDWFELYNIDTQPVPLANLYLTDDPSEVGRAKFQIPALSYITGRGWTEFVADNSPALGPSHVNFSLDGAGEMLRLSSNDGVYTAIDAITFGTQSTSTTEGRVLDGQSVQPGLTPTPGAANILPPAPSISQHPTTQTAVQGTTVPLTITANGSAPLSYQWQKNEIDIGGANSATLTLAGVTAGSEGAYRCIVTNSAGSATSNPANLIVSQNFAQWAAANGVSGVNGDGDGDGLPNIQEFFHHLDPLVPPTVLERTNAVPVAALEMSGNIPTFLTLTFRRNVRASLTSVTYEIGTALTSWSPATPDFTEILSTDPNGDEHIRVKFSLNPGDTRKFLRMVFTE